MNENNPTFDWNFVFCDENDLPVLFETRDDVLRKNRENGCERLLIIDVPNEGYRSFLQAPDFVLGVKANGRTIAFMIVTFGSEPLTMFRDELPELKTKPESVAYIELALVQENYRGYGLQKRMLREVERILRERGTSKITAIVSPENQPSLQSLLKSGYKEIGSFIYHGFPRLKTAKSLDDENVSF